MSSGLWRRSGERRRPARTRGRRCRRAVRVGRACPAARSSRRARVRVRRRATARLRHADLVECDPARSLVDGGGHHVLLGGGPSGAESPSPDHACPSGVSRLSRTDWLSGHACSTPKAGASSAPTRRTACRPQQDPTESRRECRHHARGSGSQSAVAWPVTDGGEDCGALLLSPATSTPRCPPAECCFAREGAASLCRKVAAAWRGTAFGLVSS